MIPGQPLIYERANGVVYARYRDPPHNKIERWIIGGDPDAIAKATGSQLSYRQWRELEEIAKTNIALKTQLDKVLDLYYLLKKEN
jgi:hypothetical protein